MWLVSSFSRRYQLCQISSLLTFRRCGGGWCHLLWFLLFSMCYSLHVAVNVCINCSFLHLLKVVIRLHDWPTPLLPSPNYKTARIARGTTCSIGVKWEEVRHIRGVTYFSGCGRGTVVSRRDIGVDVFEEPRRRLSRWRSPWWAADSRRWSSPNSCSHTQTWRRLLMGRPRRQSAT